MSDEAITIPLTIAPGTMKQVRLYLADPHMVWQGKQRETVRTLLEYVLQVGTPKCPHRFLDTPVCVYCGWRPPSK